MAVYDDPPVDLTTAVATQYDDRFGDLPQVIGRAPGRVNLIGEHTDYNAGLCLPMALPHATFAALGSAPGADCVVASTHTDEIWTGPLSAVAPGSVPGWAAYPVGVLWALREHGWDVPAVQLLVDSTVPVGAGLSSSAALECSVGVAVDALLEHSGDQEGGSRAQPRGGPAERRRAIVDAAVRAEAEMAGAPTGGLDQTVSMLAVAGQALMIDFADGSTRPVPLDLRRAGLAVMIVDTRVSHALNDGGYRRRVQECRLAAAALGVAWLRDATLDDLGRISDPVLVRRARHVVSENARVTRTVESLQAGDWARVGELMTASHESLRDDYEVSAPELDLVVSTALASGALGARMTGGGFGGSAIALVADAEAEQVARACRTAFDGAGLAGPGIVLAEAGPAASGRPWPSGPDR